MANIVKNVTKAVSKADQGVDLAFDFISKNASVKRQARKMEQTMSTVKKGRGASRIGTNQSVSVNRKASTVGSSYKKGTTLKPGATSRPTPMYSNAPIMIDRSAVGVKGQVKSNEAVNPIVGKTANKKPRKRAIDQASKQSKSREANRKAANQKTAEDIAQNKANKAGRESIEQSSEQAKEVIESIETEGTETESKFKSSFQGFLKEINPEDVSDEYAYIAKKRLERAENRITDFVDAGLMTPEAGAQLGRQVSENAKGFSSKAAKGGNSRKDLYEDLVNDYAKQGGRKKASLMDKGNATLEMAQAYFLSGDGTRNAKRIGTAVGAYGVGAYGVRRLSGGDATYNSRGERDIVGIPFF